MPAAPPRPPRRRLRRWLLVVAAVGASAGLAAVALLPTLIGTEFARGKILARINAQLAPGRLAVDRFEVSWAGPTRLVGCRLYAPDGGRVVDTAAAELDRSLGGLIFRRHAPTVLDLGPAMVAVDRRADGRLDLGEALQAAIAHPDPDRDLTIRIRRGSIRVRSAGLTDPIIAATADLDLRIPPAPRATDWDLRLEHAGGGRLGVRGDVNRWTAQDNDPARGELRLAVAAREWPIAIRAADLAATGRLDGSVELARRGGRWNLEASTRLLDFRATGPRLRGDTLDPGPVALGCDLIQDSVGWRLRHLTFDSAIAALRAEGKLDQGFGIVTAAGQAQRIEGRLDLAALARQLPHALRLRPGLVVEGGSARLLAEATGPRDGGVFTLEATVADLVARDGGRHLGLREPATIAAEVVRAGDEVTIRKLSARTAFLTATASGRLDDATWAGSADLGALRAQLADWVDLGPLDGSGRVELAGSYRVRDRRYAAALAGKVRDLRLSGIAAAPIDRPLTTLDLAVGGPAGSAGWPTPWDTLELTAASGTSTARVGCQPAGDAVAVQARVAADLPAAGPGRRGEATLAGSWSGANRLFRCDHALVRLDPAAADRGDRLELAAAGEYDGRAGTIRVVPIAAPGAGAGPIRLAPEGIMVSGLGRDLEQLQVAAGFEGNLPILAPDGPAGAAAGRWSGMVAAQGTAGGVGFSARAAVDPAGGRDGSLVVVGRYARADDRIEVTECRAGSALGGFAATAQVDAPADERRFVVRGEVAPNFAALTDWLRGHVEPGATLAGQPRPFQLGGVLSGPDPIGSIAGEIGIDLREADVYGIRLGPTAVVLRPRGGQILVDPISTTLNEGHVRLEPEILLHDSQGDPVLRLGKNSSVRDARINDEVSRRVLAFVAPVLEGATRASGRVSVDLDHAEIPLRPGRSRRAQVDGQVVFADVAFAPGPLANDLLGAIGRRDATLKLDRPVTLTIADGRVNQSGLALPVGDLTRIELAGWVDFDRNLALTATLPVTPAMLGNNPLLTDIAAGTQVRLPIGGTLGRPTIDRDAFAANLKDLGMSLLTRGATRGALELLMRARRPRDPDEPAAAPPPRSTPEERKALRQERRAERKARREAPPDATPDP